MTSAEGSSLYNHLRVLESAGRGHLHRVAAAAAADLHGGAGERRLGGHHRPRRRQLHHSHLLLTRAHHRRVCRRLDLRAIGSCFKSKMEGSQGHFSANLHGAHVDPLLSRTPGSREDADISRAAAAAYGGGAARGLDGVDGDGDDLPHARLRVRLHGLVGQIAVTQFLRHLGNSLSWT